MRRRPVDRFYLLCVVALAALFVADVVSAVVTSGPSAATPPVRGAGEPRDVDVDRLRRRIREGRLSDREADFARPVDGSSRDLHAPKAR